MIKASVYEGQHKKGFSHDLSASLWRKSGRISNYINKREASTAHLAVCSTSLHSLREYDGVFHPSLLPPTWKMIRWCTQYDVRDPPKKTSAMREGRGRGTPKENVAWILFCRFISNADNGPLKKSQFFKTLFMDGHQVRKQVWSDWQVGRWSGDCNSVGLEHNRAQGLDPNLTTTLQ